MSDYDFDLSIFIWIGVIIGIAIWGCWGLVDWMWIDDAIRVSKPIVPELELVVKDNIIDTVYVYRQ